MKKNPVKCKLVGEREVESNIWWRADYPFHKKYFGPKLFHLLFHSFDNKKLQMTSKNVPKKRFFVTIEEKG